MITVRCTNILYDDGIVLDFSRSGDASITVSGHAVKVALNESGKESRPLLCSAVSAMAMNLLRSFHIIAGIEPLYSEQSGDVRIVLAESDVNEANYGAVTILIESFLIGIIDMKARYPEFITLEMLQDNEINPLRTS